MQKANWQLGLRGVAGVFALGLVIGMAPSAVWAQLDLCGNGTDGTVCVGDCNGDGSVTVDEIVTMVNAALSGGIGGCDAGDADGSGSITVDEIVTAVNNALNGCPSGGAGGLDAGEECDDGGRCVGGADAGDACTAEADCEGNGACFGGLDDLRGCDGNEDCREGVCRKCRPYGGDGCAANCTLETDNPYVLVPGQVAGTGDMIIDGTSGAVVFGPFLTVPLPLNGSQILTIGKIRDGQATAVLRASGIDLDPIPVSTIACACVRGATSSTCGGTLFDAEGVQSPNCTPGFGGIVECPATAKCAPVHGPGNTGSGFIGCGSNGVDIEFVQDCNATPGGEPFDPIVTITNSTESVPAGEGSAYLIITSAIGTVVGGCAGTTAEYGPDGMFCTDDDPTANRGTPNSIPFTTNNVEATVLNPADFEDILGPFGTVGTPFTCSGNTIAVSGTNLAGAFTSCDQPTVSDIAVPVNFVSQ